MAPADCGSRPETKEQTTEQTAVHQAGITHEDCVLDVGTGGRGASYGGFGQHVPHELPRGEFNVGSRAYL